MTGFDIILFAAIAAFLFYRLWSVLGQRGEGEDTRPRDNPFVPPAEQNSARDEEDVMVLEGSVRPVAPSALTRGGHAPTSLAGALDQIKVVDPSFDEKQFIEGAKSAFQGIVAAFAAADLSPVAWLLGPAVLTPFEAAIAARKAKGETLENRIDRIVAADIVAARIEDSVATLTVEFVSYQVNVTRDASNAIIDGRPDRAEEIRDTWILRRDLKSENPNWQLVETRS